MLVPLNDSIAHKLYEYRHAKRLKQKDMAVLLGCSQSQYSLWETGKLKPHPLRMNNILEIIK